MFVCKWRLRVLRSGNGMGDCFRRLAAIRRSVDHPGSSLLQTLLRNRRHATEWLRSDVVNVADAALARLLRLGPGFHLHRSQDLEAVVVLPRIRKVLRVLGRSRRRAELLREALPAVRVGVLARGVEETGKEECHQWPQCWCRGTDLGVSR